MISPLLARGFRFILLRGKKPLPRNGHHWITTDHDEIRSHRGNVGIMAGDHVVLDFDRADLLPEMSAALGPLVPTVETGSGKLHCYVQPVAGLPRAFYWHSIHVGEIVRLASEYTVCPPSIHPETNRPYRWLVDPLEPFQALPELWQAHLIINTPGHDPERPAFVANGDTRGVPDDEPWTGPPADELLRRAMLQPGARRRGTGVKFQCPGCRAGGWDKPMDNAIVRLDGRWGCAVDPDHKRAIGEALGVLAPDPTPPVAGYDSRLLRKLGLRL